MLSESQHTHTYQRHTKNRAETQPHTTGPTPKACPPKATPTKGSMPPPKATPKTTTTKDSGGSQSHQHKHTHGDDAPPPPPLHPPSQVEAPAPTTAAATAPQASRRTVLQGTSGSPMFGVVAADTKSSTTTRMGCGGAGTRVTPPGRIINHVTARSRAHARCRGTNREWEAEERRAPSSGRQACRAGHTRACRVHGSSRACMGCTNCPAAHRTLAMQEATRARVEGLAQSTPDR